MKKARRTSGHTGCLGLVLILSIFMIPSQIKSFANTLRLGEWEEYEDGSFFVYYQEFTLAPKLVTLFVILNFVAMGLLLWKYLRSQRVVASNEKYLALPPLGANLEFWKNIHRNPKKQFLKEYTTEEEARSGNKGSLPLALGVFLISASHLFVPALLSGSEFLPDEPSLRGVLVNLLPLVPGYLLTLWAIRSGESQLKLDQRLIFDFDKKEVQKIDIHDALAEPTVWLKFDQLSHLLLMLWCDENGRGGSLLQLFFTKKNKLILMDQPVYDGIGEVEREIDKLAESMGVQLKKETR